MNLKMLLSVSFLSLNAYRNDVLSFVYFSKDLVFPPKYLL